MRLSSTPGSLSSSTPFRITKTGSRMGVSMPSPELMPLWMQSCAQCGSAVSKMREIQSAPVPLCAFDVGVYRLITDDPVTDREYIDSFFRAHAYNGDIDSVGKLRCCTVVENNDGEPAVNAGIYAEDLHVIIPGRGAA